MMYAYKYKESVVYSTLFALLMTFFMALFIYLKMVG